MRALIFLLFFSVQVNAQPCVVNVCNSLLPTARCFRKVIRHSGRIDLPKGYFVASGCNFISATQQGPPARAGR